MSRDKRICCVLIGLLLLSGCSPLPGGGARGAAVPVPSIVPVQPKDIAQSDRPVTSLYFFSSAKSSLVVSTRMLTASREQNKAYEILTELAAGPSDLSVEPVLPDGTAIEALEISQGIATVTLSSRFNTLDEYGRFVARAALTNTLLEVDGIDVVNILAGGRAMQFNGAPVGALLRQYPRDLDLLYQKSVRQDGVIAAQTQEDVQPLQPLEGQQQQPLSPEDTQPSADKTVTRRMVLYFPDGVQGMLLAEHREVTVPVDKAAQAVLEELAKGPADTQLMQVGIPAEIALYRPPVLEQSDGRYTLNLDFNAQFAAELSKKSPQQVKEAVASLVLSLTGFVPQVDYVRLLVVGQPYTPVSLAALGGNASIRGYARSDFAAMVGNTVGLYFPTENQDAMRRVMRPVQQAGWHLAATRLEELAKGRAGEDEQERIWVWPQPADEAGQPSVTGQVGDAVFVDLPQSLINTFFGMSAQQERMTIYCIVNTLVDTQGITRVYFQSNGKPIENWPGLLSINSAFVRNPGLIQAMP